VGIVTLDDLILSGAAGFEELREILRAQIRYEAVRKPALGNRSDEKKEQTYNKFLKHLGRHMDLDGDTAEAVIVHVLKLLVRRMTATAAVNFICQLPGMIQDELYSLPAGPDTSISTLTFSKDVGRLMKERDHEIIHDTLCGLWKGLETHFGHNNIDFVLANLPLDLQALFGHINEEKAPKSVKRTKAPKTKSRQQPLPAGGSS
jgi:uncharacterized protein (DUF2267 family)